MTKAERRLLLMTAKLVRRCLGHLVDAIIMPKLHYDVCIKELDEAIYDVERGREQKTVPVFESVEVNEVKGRGTVITIDIDCAEGKKLERLVHVRSVDPDVFDHLIVEVDGKRWEVTTIERSTADSLAGLVVKEVEDGS